jgi:phage gp36-like protein
MAYISNADIEERLGSDAYVQLTDDDGDGVADVGVVDEARQGAEGEVDSCLAKRYKVPVDVESDGELAALLASIALDLVEFRLRSRRPPIPDEAKAQAKRAREWLQDVANGTAELASAERLESGYVPGPISQSSGEPRMLSHDELSSY